MEENERRERQPRLAEESARQQKYWRKNYLWTIAILAVFLVVSFFRGGGPSLSLGEDRLTMQTPDDQVYEVRYEDVTTVSLLYGANYGTCLEGKGEGRYLYGRWENAAWGEYDLCVTSKIDCCLLIETEKGTLAINYSSEEETEQLCELLESYCGNPA